MSEHQQVACKCLGCGMMFAGHEGANCCPSCQPRMLESQPGEIHRIRFTTCLTPNCGKQIIQYPDSPGPLPEFCPECLVKAGCECAKPDNIDRLIKLNEIMASYLQHAPMGGIGTEIEATFFKVNQYLAEQLLPKEQQK